VATPTVNPNVTPHPGGSVEVVSRADVHGLDGDTVNAGSFRINNTSNSTETVTAIRLQATNSVILSSMTLSAGGQSATVSSPGADNTFTFSPGFEVPPDDSTEVSLIVTIEGSTSNSSETATPESTTTPSGTTAPTETPTFSIFSSASDRGAGGAT